MHAIRSTLLAFTFAAGSMGVAHASDWALDPAHSQVRFKVKHMVVSTVEGSFTKFNGIVNLDDKDPAKSTVEVTIDAASIDTHEPKRDAHLKSPDFFDVEKNPKITFKSTKVDKAGKGKFKVTGDLTMHGVTKPVVLNVEGPSPEMKNPWGVPVRVVSAQGKLNRKDYGLNWNKALEAGGVLVGDEVTLDISAELNPKQDKPEAAAAAKAETKPTPASTKPAPAPAK
jgi:polyisoprenoid-binding protein YceI